MAGVRFRRLEWRKELNDEKVRPDVSVTTNDGARSFGWGKSRFRHRECVYRDSSHAWDEIMERATRQELVSLVPLKEKKKKNG